MERYHHQAWKIALGSMVSVGISLGVGRFAFTPMLPLMLHDQIITLNQASWLATANYAGYLIGALLCMVMRGSVLQVIRLGLIFTVLLTLCMGMSQLFWVLALVRGLSGFVSAVLFVYTMGWGLQRLTELGFLSLSGLLLSGLGLGIIVTGVVVTLMGYAHWASGHVWQVIALISGLLVALIWPTFSEKNNIHPARVESHPHSPAKIDPFQRKPLSKAELKYQTNWLIIGYGLEGFGYIVIATFLPIIAQIELPNSGWDYLFWPSFGLSIVIGSILSTKISPQIDNRLILSVCYVLQAIGILLMILSNSVVIYILSGILVGIPLSAIGAFAMHEARRLRGNAAHHLIGLMTASFGLGQICGPPIAVALVARSHSFHQPMEAAMFALIIGAIVFAMLAFQTNYTRHH